MKILTTLLLILITISCSKKAEKIYSKPNKKFSQAYRYEEKKNNPEISDSIKNSFLKEKPSPVKIISATLLKSEYSDHKDIQLTYKNVTRKNIKAIKFEWYCENVFEKPASGQFFYVKGIAKGHTDNLLKSGRIQSKRWEDFSTDAYTIIAVRSYLVMFTDGTKWELK